LSYICMRYSNIIIQKRQDVKREWGFCLKNLFAISHPDHAEGAYGIKPTEIHVFEVISCRRKRRMPSPASFVGLDKKTSELKSSDVFW